MSDDPWAEFRTSAPASTSASDPWAEFRTKAASTPSAASTSSDDSTDIPRQVALEGRAVGEGVLGTALGGSIEAFGKMTTGSSVNDAVLEHYTGKNAMQHDIAQFNSMFGTKVPEAKSIPDLLTALMTKAGAPVPETDAEQARYNITKGTAAALTGSGAAGVTGAANILRAGTSGLTSSAASEAVRQEGGGPLAQATAGVLGGFAPAALEGAVHVAGNVLRPLTRSGQQTIVADTLQRNVQDKGAAIANLDASQPIVPGSEPTTGPVSRDLGLLALEKGVKAQNSALFSQRASEQNAARQAALSAVAGDPADIARLSAARGAAGDAERTAALGNPVGGTIGAPVNFVTDKIDSILASPTGKRDIPSAALNWLKEKLVAADGTPETDPANLYAVRQDIGDALGGKLSGDKAAFKLASKELMNVRGTLDDVIESAAPGFKAYIQRFAESSKPINQMEVMQEIQRRAQATGYDVPAQQQIMDKTQFQRALRSAMDDENLTQLTPAQTEKLKAISADLDLGQAINTSLKSPGSDTFQNMSIAQAIGAGKNPMHPVASLISTPLKWIYQMAGSDKGISDLLAKAMLNPKLASDMLKQATPQSARAFSSRLENFAKFYGIPTTASTAAVNDPSQLMQQDN